MKISINEIFEVQDYNYDVKTQIVFIMIKGIWWALDIKVMMYILNLIDNEVVGAKYTFAEDNDYISEFIKLKSDFYELKFREFGDLIHVIGLRKLEVFVLCKMLAFWIEKNVK